MTRAKHSPLFVSRDLFETRYAGADVIFMAGSVVRGEASTYSDIDLIVVFPNETVPARESFTHKEWPVEAFIHAPKSLQTQFEREVTTGYPLAIEMIHEGLEVPIATKLSENLKESAAEFMAAGPAILSNEQIEDRRYRLSDMLDDIREPRSWDDVTATASLLFNDLADFYFRGRGSWSARGKSVVRKLKKSDATLCRRYTEAFESLYSQNQISKVVSLAEDILAPYGGLLFEGYRRERPEF